MLSQYISETYSYHGAHNDILMKSFPLLLTTETTRNTLIEFLAFDGSDQVEG